MFDFVWKNRLQKLNFLLFGIFWNEITNFQEAFNLKTPRGGGLLSIFVQQGCAVFQGIVFAYFSRTGYQKKANFLEQVVITCQKRTFCYNRLLFRQIFVFLSILFTDFSRTGYHLKVKILEQGEKIFFHGHIPIQI